MKTHSTQLLRFVVTVATAAVGVGRVLGANLLYFHEGSLVTARGLYDYDTVSGLSTFRTSVPGPLGGNPRLFSFDVRPSDGTVFATDQGGNRFMTINPNTGQTREIGGLGNGLFYGDLAFDAYSGTLFGLQFEEGTLRRALIAIGTSDGRATEIGTLPFSGYGSTGLEFLADGSLVLYESVSGGLGVNDKGRLYRVNRTTAALTLIGDTQGIDTLQDLAHIGNRLFATSFGWGGTFLWEIDVTTGHPTALNAPARDRGYGGLVALTPIPEPSASVLLGSGIAGLVTLRRRNARAALVNSV